MDKHTVPCIALGLALCVPAWAQQPAGETAPAGEQPAGGGATAPADEQPAGGATAPGEGPDLGGTTTPGANVQGQPAEGQSPAEGQPAETPPPADDGLPAWEPAPGNEPQPGATTPSWDAAAGPAAEVSFPWIESHGYFRFRTNLFHNLDLDTYSRELSTGTSPFLPPLTERDRNGAAYTSGHPEDASRGDGDEGHSYPRGADSIADANLRFRYAPTLHISENLRVRSVMDILDNLVLGSTPDGGTFAEPGWRPDVPLETFSGSQRPPESGVNGFKDAVRVKALWGEWRTPLGQLLFGRQPSQWGLGILANSGSCLDCDFGDYVDRVMGVTRLFGTYVALAWDFPAEGPVDYSGQHDLYNQPFGQPHDLDQLDEANQYVIALFRRPVSQEERELRERELNTDRKPVFDWGVYNVIRSQEFTFLDSTTTPQVDPDPTTNGTLRDVKAFAYIPDVWLNFQYHPRRDHEIRLSLEAAGIFGAIEEVPALATRAKIICEDPTAATLEECPDGQRIEQRRRDLEQWGYALEYDHRIEKLSWGLRQGAASGDDTEGFGVLDKNPIDPAASTPDDKVTNFKFDRDYIVDLILFRELIGSVTNAVYIQPYISYDFIRDDREAWGFKLSPMYAFALDEDATPGDESPLGLEFDLELYVHEFDKFKWNLQYGLLFPFGAFNLLDPQNPDGKPLADPGVAQTLQMNVYMVY